MKLLLAIVVAAAAEVAVAERGEVVKLGGLNTYTSGAANATAVILASDIFGYTLPRLREIADKVAGAGFYAVVPDFFRGAAFFHGWSYKSWIIAHPPEKGIEDAKVVVEALKSKGITKIGGVGFCWGGKVVVDMLKDPLIQAGVLIHPTSTTVADIERISAPVSIIAGENDKITHVKLIRQFEAALKAKPDVESMVKIFPKQGHGWTVVYDSGNATAVKSAEEAHNDMLHWLRTHLTAAPAPAPAASSSSPNRGLQQLVPPAFFFLLSLFLH